MPKKSTKKQTKAADKGAKATKTADKGAKATKESANGSGSAKSKRNQSWSLTNAAKSAEDAPSRAGRPIEIEDLYAFRLVGDPAVSPDGKQAVVAVTGIDKEEDAYRSALWQVPVNGDAPTQLTSGQWNDAEPRWSPDGQFVAFTSKRDTDANQLWVLPMTGGEARRVTNLETGAGSHSWAPDSKRLAFTSAVKPEKDDEESDVRVIRNARYRFDGRGYLDDKHTHVWTIDTSNPDAEPTRLTEGDFSHNQPQWSPTGREIVFVANRDADWDTAMTNDVWTIPATGGEPRKLTDGKGQYNSPVWSPDGTQLAVAGVAKATGTYQHALLWTIPSGGGTPQLLGKGLDRPIGGMSSSPIRWTADGKAIDALVADRGSMMVLRVDVANGAMTRLTGERRSVQGFDHTGANLVVAMADPTTPVELRKVSQSGEVALTTFNAEWTATVGIATPEEFTVTVNGDEVQGWLLRPAGNSSESAKVPVILHIHGGPHAQYSDSFMHELQMYAARGFALVFVNPRGSVGYGEKFAQGVVASWGESDTPDLMAALDHVVSLGGLDETRIGVTGGSYGGFMTNWLLGRTDRFRAGVTDRSISNMISMAGTDDIGLVSLYPEFGTPWENHERYWELSPLKYVGNITAPLLVVHSEEDYRCPIEQGEQLYMALKAQGKTTEFVRFPNESHGLSRNGAPKHRVERLQRTLGWFEKYL